VDYDFYQIANSAGTGDPVSSPQESDSQMKQIICGGLSLGQAAAFFCPDPGAGLPDFAAFFQSFFLIYVRILRGGIREPAE